MAEGLNAKRFGPKRSIKFSNADAGAWLYSGVISAKQSALHSRSAMASSFGSAPIIFLEEWLLFSLPPFDQICVAQTRTVHQIRNGHERDIQSYLHPNMCSMKNSTISKNEKLYLCIGQSNSGLLLVVSMISLGKIQFTTTHFIHIQLHLPQCERSYWTHGIALRPIVATKHAILPFQEAFDNSQSIVFTYSQLLQSGLQQRHENIKMKFRQSHIFDEWSVNFTNALSIVVRGTAKNHSQKHFLFALQVTPVNMVEKSCQSIIAVNLIIKKINYGYDWLVTA